MTSPVYGLVSTREVVYSGIQTQENIWKISEFYGLCFIVFYAVRFGGQYIECEKMHCINNKILSNTECPGGNVPDFKRMFLTLKYTDITQNTCIRCWTVTEIVAREFWKYDCCYTLIDYQIHIKTARNM